MPWHESMVRSRSRKKRYLANLRYTCKSKVDRNGDPVRMLLDSDRLDTLLEHAGITIEDVGRGKGAYCLARVDDIGDYQIGNARFVTQEENSSEYWNNLTEEEKEEHRQRGRDAGAQYGVLGTRK